MKMKLSIAAVAVLTLTAQAMQSPLRFPHNEQEALNSAMAMSLHDQYNAVPQRPVQIQQQNDDLQRALELSAQEYEREVASREAQVAQQEKEELEEAQRLSIKKLNEEFVNAVKHRATVAATDIQEFLDQGANIEACDSEGLTSLMLAARLGFLDIVKHLTKAGANTETRDKWWGQTALNHAAVMGNIGCLTTLLDQGADTEVVDNKKATPLHRASGWERVECMKALIDYGANIDAQDENGDTPLARAVMNNKKNAAELLINSGANALLPDYKGVTPFEKAMIGRSINFPLCILLANSGVPFKPHFLTVLVLPMSVSRNSIDLARAIISNIWLLCPSEQEMKPRYARLKTVLLCMNRVLGSTIIPKDVRRLILCSDSELAMDLVLVFYYRLCKGDALNKFQLNLLKQRLPEYLMNNLKSDLDIAFLETVYSGVGRNPKFISIFDRSTLESNFGQAIRTNIINRLNALQQKALANNETKENK